MRFLLLCALLLPAVPASALSADLNKDGTVDFDDFFLFTDQFGQSGDPDVSDTIRVTQTDTLVLVDTLVVSDTLVVIDTVFVDPSDTVTRSGTPILFPDPALEFTIRDLVGVATGDLLTGDVDGLTSLNLTGRNLSLIDGLEHFTSVQTLSLADNAILDLSPLQDLAQLRSLSLANNQIRDLTPLIDNAALGSGTSIVLVGNALDVVSRTTHVRTLQDRGATVTADPFAVTFADSSLEAAIRDALQQDDGDLLHLDLETITELTASGDSIQSLSGLEFVRNLTHLDLSDNEIRSITQLSRLPDLEVLNLSNNSINSFSPLTLLTSMRELRLENTGLASVSRLVRMIDLEVLYLNVNQLDDITGLEVLTGLRQLNLRDNDLTSVAALTSLAELDDLWLEGNDFDDVANDPDVLALIAQGTFVRF